MNHLHPLGKCPPARVGPLRHNQDPCEVTSLLETPKHCTSLAMRGHHQDIGSFDIDRWSLCPVQHIAKLLKGQLCGQQRLTLAP